MVSQRRRFLLEIQGDNTVFTGAGHTAPPVTWSQTNFVEAIASIPPIQSMEVDPFTGRFGNGGLSVVSVEAASYIQERKTSGLSTTLSADLARGATSPISVASTTGFPTNGTIWIDGEAINYVGTTGTTFGSTSVTRGVLGTRDVAHAALNAPANSATRVLGYNPTWFGRKCQLHTFEPGDPINTKTTIAVGYIDGINFTESGFSLDLISVAQQLENETIASGVRAKGALRGSERTLHNTGGFSTVTHFTKAIGESRTPHHLIVEVEDQNYPFPYNNTVTAGVGGKVGNAWIQIGDEVFKYSAAAYPGVVMTVSAVGTTSGIGPYIDVDGYHTWFRTGDSIRFTDSATSATIDAVITRKTSTNRIYHNRVGMAPAANDTVTVPGLQRLSVVERAQAGTKQAEHEAGAVVEQVYVQTGNLVDETLHLLLSGNGSGGTYDTLPDWLGAALPSDEVDIDSFRTLVPYSPNRRVVFREPTSPKRVLETLALVTGGRVYVSHEGKVTARRDFSPYPDTVSQHAVSVDNVIRIPGWATRIDRIYNHMIWPATDGKAVFHMDESARLYGKRSLPSPPKELFELGTQLDLAAQIAIPILMRVAEPAPEITVESPTRETDIMEPGELVSVTMAHLPDQKGDEGLTGERYEVIGFTPNSDTATIRLLRLPQQGNVGLIAPAGIVSGVSGSDVTLEPASTSRLSNLNANFSITPVGAILGDGEGEEDVYWFLANDSLQFIDLSTLGNATPTTATATISSIDYPSRTITLTAAAPAWLAAGDIVRLGTYATVKAGLNQAKRTPFFIAWADDPPLLPGGDDPYVWGM